MAKIDPALTESIHRNLTAHILEHYERYYYLAYSLVKNQEGAVKVVTNAVYFSLYNGRKLEDLPPMHVWILQLVIKDGMRAMNRGAYPRDFTKDSRCYAYMETLEPSAVNAFKLYYFEGLNVEKVGEVLHFSREEVLKRLAYIRSEMHIDSSMDEESETRLQELADVYESAELPEGLKETILSAIRREEENFASFLKKYQKDKIRKPLGLLILIIAFFFITLFLGRRNPIFAESILSTPFVNKLFAPFF
jgi:hypothetical protein